MKARGDTYKITAVDQEKRSVTIGVDIQADRIQVGRGSDFHVVRMSRIHSHRLRFPFGRADRSVQDVKRMGWIATSRQCRHGVTPSGLDDAAKASAAARLLAISLSAIDAVDRRIKGVRYNGNPRQGWRPDGSEIPA